MRKSAIGLIVVGAAASLALAACSSDKKDTPAPAGGSSTSASTGSGGLDGKGAKVGIILPDTQSSQRWVTSDPQAMAAECKKVNLSCDIQNAQNDAGKMKTIAESMANNGVKVLMITNLDSGSGAAIQAEAQGKGITTIDYDRLTLGGKAALYISYDNVAVGTAQGTALAKCPQVAGKSAVKYVDVNGAPTDNNATLFKQGYDGVLSKQSGWTKADDQSIAKWDNAVAGTTFTAMLRKNPDINAVMVANDGMANSVIAALKNQKLNGKVAVSGQDATAQGLQNIMTGDQCFSIYKPSSPGGRAGHRRDRPDRQRPDPADHRDDQGHPDRPGRPGHPGDPDRDHQGERGAADQRRLHPEGPGLHRQLRRPVQPERCQVSS